MATIGKYGKIVFSETDIQFIKDNFFKLNNDDLAAALGCKKTVVRTKGYELGLKRMEMEYWTAEQVTFLKENYKQIGDTEMAEIFENEWPKNKTWTKKHIEKKRRYLVLKRTAKDIESIFIRNKKSGRLAVANTKMWLTRGKHEIGLILVWKQSTYKMAYIKTATGHKPYNRWLWTKERGVIPHNYNVVRKAGCPDIPTIEFLECISKQDHAIRNRDKFLELPEDLKEIITIKNKITKQITQNESRNNN